jgi:hypothetical protein
VCTMCAPGDPRKSSDSQREQAELNALVPGNASGI